MHSLLVSIARISQTHMDENWDGVLNGSVANAIRVIPRMSPPAVANIDPDRLPPGRVTDSVDQSQTLRSALSKGPLKISYTTTEPLIPTNDLTDVLERLAAVEDELQTLKDATLPIIPISLRAFIDCLLYSGGYNPNEWSRLMFISANENDFCGRFGVDKDDLKTFVSDHISDTTNAAHSTTSLAIADAITRMNFKQDQREKLKKVFERFFRMTVEQQLAGRGAKVFLVDARWPLSSNLDRVTEMRRGSGAERSWQTRLS